MSVCLESSSTVHPSQVGKLQEQQQSSQSITSPSVEQELQQQLPVPPTKNSVAKLIVTSQGQENTVPLLQKVVNSPVITVVNTPITVVKTVGGATQSHFTLVNSTVKSPPTITLVNAPPITVVKLPDQGKIELAAASTNTTNNGNLPIAAITEKPAGIHNVFVKKSAPAEGGAISIPDMPQSHKLLTANSFPTSNVIPNLGTGPVLKTANGQRSLNNAAPNKVKILSNVVMPSSSSSNPVPGPSNIVLNKNHRYYQQKVVGNGATKYLNKPPDKQRVYYPMPKGQLKSVPGYKPPPVPPPSSSSIKNVSPGAVQRTGTGLRTIPPQRPSLPNKPNYIGKHAVQAQKMKPKVKTKLAQMANHTSRPQHPPEQSAQMIFNQALTAQILETLSDKESPTKLNSYLNTKYEPKLETPPPKSAIQQIEPREREFKPKNSMSLDALSFVCHAVLLDHNYNATLPSEPAPVPIPPEPPMNGTQQFSPVPSYPPGISTIKRNRTTSQTMIQQRERERERDDDAASDVSEERKNDTEGEETDTAPEAEEVTNEPNDRYGDYVTRCICGFIHDDGYMIECDRCKVWQHVRCVVRTKKVPDDYLCEECDTSKHTDRQKARALQQQWMRDIQERDAKIRKEQMALTDSDSSDGETHNKNRRKEPPRRQRRDSLQNRSAKPGKRKERKVPTKRTKAKPPPGKSDDEKLPQLRQWIENYEEAVTNHYSPELRARISSIRLNGAHSELNGNVDPSVNKCKVQTIPPGVKCLVAAVSLPLGTPVVELRGKYMLSTQHRTTTRQQRPGPFLFFHTLIKDTEVCVDTRTYGNCARFIRRSCTPNAELQHVLEKGAVHLYIVTTKSIDKGGELTIRHESHDIAAAHLTEIPCACINPEYCALIKGHRRHNGDIIAEGRKRRGRQNRDNSLTSPTPLITTTETEEEDKKVKVEDESEIEEKVVAKKEEIVEPEILKEETPPVKIEIEPEPPVEIKVEVKEDVVEEEEAPKPVIKEEEEPMEVKEEVPEIKLEIKCEVVNKEEEDEDSETTPPPVTIRRSSRNVQESPAETTTPSAADEKKSSREERKLQAIMRAIERMERQEARRQEHQAKQANRRESEPPVQNTTSKDDSQKLKRRKRKGRSRTISTNSRRNRLDSADSLHSSDETLLSPPSESPSPTKAAGLLLALANGDNSRKSPERTMDSNSNSAHSSPETPLSSACLLVAAAVEPLEPGFKFPKTKKGLMNEWLNKADIVQSASAISPSSLTPHIETTPIILPPVKNLTALVQAATYCDQPPRSGSAKKRWLRQAISEDQCDSPPQGNTNETVAPPKKRRLPRESLSTDTSPPDTPTNPVAPQVEIVTHQDDGNSPAQMESEATLNDLATEMRQEYGNCVQLPPRPESPTTVAPDSPLISTAPQTPILEQPTRSIMDPRLARFANSEQLVGTVEKTLSFLGFEEAKKPEAITPAKRKLSITEYRQRKKLNNNEKITSDEISIMDESNSSQSPKLPRTRSNSTSSVTSGSTTDDELVTTPLTPVPEAKALSAFNSEPTELERQRESVSLRLKKALGLPVQESLDAMKTPIDVETILKVDLPEVKTTVSLPSPSFPIPGSAELPIVNNGELVVANVVEGVKPLVADVRKVGCVSKEVLDGESEPVLFYTPDDEEAAEPTSYVPPFNNPLYPNTSYATYGSVIDDDVPYEGRNPSPPPDLSSP